MTRKVSATLVSVLVLAGSVVALASCGGPTRSAAAYCSYFYGEGSQLRNRWIKAGDHAGEDPFAALSSVFATVPETASFMHELSLRAPETIAPDVQILAEALKRVSKQAGASNLLGLFASGVVDGLATGRAEQRVNEYTSRNCPQPAQAPAPQSQASVELLYRARPIATSRVTGESLDRTIDVMRVRLAQLGLPEADARRSGSSSIRIVLPASIDGQRAQELVGETAQLHFYDWEPNVIGPNGQPGPSETTVTGGLDAGASTYGITEYQAIQSAAKRAPVLRSSDTTWTPGCTAAQVNGCFYGTWYLLDAQSQTVLCPGAGPTCAPAVTKADLYANGYTPPTSSTPVAVRVNPGTVLVQALAVKTASGGVINSIPNSWYVLNDEPFLTGSAITNPRQGTEEGGSGQPDVVFGFTASGKSAFDTVTKKIAERGQETQLPGVSQDAALQHFAVVLDRQLISVPSIDHTKHPGGVDASEGSQISGGFTLTSAQNLANELRSGPLPVDLELTAGNRS